MTLEEKMKKRQEIQQEITALNKQLRQHQIEQRKEQQSKGASMDEMLGGNQSARTAKAEQDNNRSSEADSKTESKLAASYDSAISEVSGLTWRIPGTRSG